MKSRSSASIASGAHSALAPSMSSWYQWSRPACISTGVSALSCPPRRTTTTFSTEGQSATATSVLALSAT